jgi:3-methyladenine DNA glycosylase AlkD
LNLDWVLPDLEGRATPGRREVTAGYFPTAMEILGVSAPEIRKVVGRLHRELKAEGPGVVLDAASFLRDLEVHECRQVAYELLDRRRDARALVGIPEVRALGQGNDNWASVDGFSVLVAGQVWREGQIPDREVLAWAQSEDRWWRRTALVCTVPLNLRSRGGSGDPRRTLAVCLALATDRDPMVARALSWALRALVGVDPTGVREFLTSHGTDLPALVRREVRNKLETGRKNR